MAEYRLSYTANEINNKLGKIDALDAHTTASNAHNDIRLLISELSARINALADSDDVTLDQMSEIVSYIKNNASLIESVTTEKINVSDIVNDLTTNVANKPLSAAQGVALKQLIDALSSSKPDLSNYYTKTETAAAIETAKAELSDSIFSDATELHIADYNGNIVATIDANGINTTAVSAKSITVNGIDIEALIQSRAQDYVNESILGGAW